MYSKSITHEHQVHAKKFFRWLKYGIALLIVLSLFYSTTSMASKQMAFEIEINGQSVTFTDAHPYIDSNNRTMVPIRFISENLGAVVGWNGTTRTVTVSKGNSVIKLQVDSDMIEVNGIMSQMDTRMVFNAQMGRNYVPLRFVTENLGSSIADWEHRQGGSVFYISIVEDGFIPVSDPVFSKENFYGITIGDDSKHVRAMLGEPTRQEPSAYGYIWWVYSQDYENYVQVGLENGRVVDLYSNSNNWQYKGIQVGSLDKEAYQQFPYLDEVIIEHDWATFTLIQSNAKPVEKYLAIADGVAVQIYLDIHDHNKVTAIRVSEPRIVLSKGGSMRWTYPSGQPPTFMPAPLTKGEQQAVDRANERQLFDLVNSIRVRMGLNPLGWHQPIADVAYNHSVDMRDNDFFAHVSPNTGGIGDRAKSANISFAYLSENIAYGQADAIEANEGLMNSYGHRVNILSDQVQFLGTGAYYKHYTQKFINPR